MEAGSNIITRFLDRIKNGLKKFDNLLGTVEDNEQDTNNTGDIADEFGTANDNLRNLCRQLDADSKTYKNGNRTKPTIAGYGVILEEVNDAVQGKTEKDDHEER